MISRTGDGAFAWDVVGSNKPFSDGVKPGQRYCVARSACGGMLLTPDTRRYCLDPVYGCERGEIVHLDLWEKDRSFSETEWVAGRLSSLRLVAGGTDAQPPTTVIDSKPRSSAKVGSSRRSASLVLTFLLRK
jgi:hypothetical protein